MRDAFEGLLLRIFIAEADQWKGKALYEAIVELALAKGMAGATAFKGLMGFGMHHEMHTAKILRLSENLPVIIDIVDTEEKVRNFVPYLEEMVAQGMITISPTNMILYKAGV